jgi:CubicO group peptidase (beta-lactamase class C family)
MAVSRWRVVSAGVVLALLIGAFLATRAVASYLEPALGFAAKVVCSSVLVGGMTIDQAFIEMPDERLATLVRTRVDAERGRVSSTVLPLLGRREASLRPGMGCTLDSPGRAVAELPPAIDTAAAIAVRYAARPAPLDLPVEAPGRGFDASRLEAAVAAAFAEPDPTVPRRTRAVVIVYDGRIIAERYADGYGPEHRFPGWSMAKSVTSALAGILVARDRLDLATNSLRPEWADPEDPRREITFEHLLHMSSGLEFDESYTPSGAATRMLFAAPSAAAFAAAHPLLHEPGTYWSYSSATTNLISDAIRRAVGGSVEDYLRFPHEALFEPAGMLSAVMEPDPAGTYVGSSFMYATARDWARFGQLYLQDGVVEGRRVLPEGWVEYSVRPAPGRLGYGAQWWLNAAPSPGAPGIRWPALPTDLYYASGFQGQHVVVLPSDSLVVVRLGVAAVDGAFDLGGFLGAVLAARTRE